MSARSTRGMASDEDDKFGAHGLTPVRGGICSALTLEVCSRCVCRVCRRSADRLTDQCTPVWVRPQLAPRSCLVLAMNVFRQREDKRVCSAFLLLEENDEREGHTHTNLDQPILFIRDVKLPA